MSSDLKTYYAKRAPEYERIYDLPERQTELVELKRVLPELVAGLDLLEVACGTGYWTRVAASAARSILATDVSDEVMAIARARDYGECDVRFELADAFDLPAGESPFNGALVAFWWSHMRLERTAEFAQGLIERLRVGARIVLLDNAFAEGSSTPIVRIDTEGNRYQRRTLADGSTWEVLKNFPHREQVASALPDGARLTEWREMEFYWLGVVAVGRR